MNTQLWAWQHNGKTEYGTQVLINGEGVYLRISADCCRHFFEVTNLRKVKVVDEDAIVLDPHLLVKGLTDGEFDTYVLKTKPKPITEPKNFGVIVEAFAKTGKVETHSRFIHIGEGLWVEEGIPQKRYYFDELTNPIVLSKGIEK